MSTIAGSAAGTATVSGMFGAWGASVGGGSAGALFSDVKEFGFWDLSQSIWVGGNSAGPKAQQQQQQPASTTGDQCADSVCDDQPQADDRYHPSQPIASSSSSIKNLFGFSTSQAKGSGSDVDADADTSTAPRRRAKVALAEDAFAADSDEDVDEFHAAYLLHPATARSNNVAGSATTTAQHSSQQQQPLLDSSCQDHHVTQPPQQDQGKHTQQTHAKQDRPLQQHMAAVDGTHRISSTSNTAASSIVRPTASRAGTPYVASGTTSPLPIDTAAGVNTTPRSTTPDTTAEASFWGKSLFHKGSNKASTLRPLLPLPVNPKHTGEAKMALTIAVNGCVSSPEDFVGPWQRLPSKDCDRYALVWESELLKVWGTRCVWVCWSIARCVHWPVAAHGTASTSLHDSMSPQLSYRSLFLAVVFALVCFPLAPHACYQYEHT